jgi:peptidyl-prolyl cis-trans isomerase SurA
MFKRFTILAILFLSFLPTFAAAGEVIDRIVATVNGHIILQSDWEDALRFESFTAGRSLRELTSADRKAALDRLIDQELLREQMKASDFPHATEDEVTARVSDIRKQYPNATSDPGWQQLLSQYRLSEEELKKRVGDELDLLRLVDARLRPTVQIDPKVIESYYSQELLPQLRHSGAKEVSLAEVSPKIKELLIQKRVNELLTAWLETLRAGSDIHDDSAASGSGGQAR